jgi:hypothetical protein
MNEVIEGLSAIKLSIIPVLLGEWMRPWKITGHPGNDSIIF